MKKHFLISAIFILFIGITSIANASMLGDEVIIGVYFPNINTPTSENTANAGEITTTVDSSVEYTYNPDWMEPPAFTIDVQDSSIYLNSIVSDDWHYWFNSGYSFNGYKISDIDDSAGGIIENVSMTYNLDRGAPILTYGDDWVVVDLQDEQFISTSWINLDITVAEPELSPNIYGLFVGSDGPNGLRADASALSVSSALLNLGSSRVNEDNFYFVTEQNIDPETGGVLTPNQALEQAIDSIREDISSNDLLFVYMAGHGSSERWWELDKGMGDEVVYLGNSDPVTAADQFDSPENWITDDELTTLLLGLDDTEKWIITDACRSGGFWGNNNFNDEGDDIGDLERLNNIGFIASAFEDGIMKYSPDYFSGQTLFSVALTEALSYNVFGKLKSDLNFDGILGFDELAFWLENDAPWYIELMTGGIDLVVREGEFGDESVWRPELWELQVERSEGFLGNISGMSINPPVPEPSTMLLLGVGLIGLAGVTRRKLKKQP